jgi:hypothetical protein
VVEVILIFIMACTMAIFGVIGYRRGFGSMFVSLLVLLFAVLLVLRSGEALLMYLNGIWMATALLLKGGLSALSQGNLEEAKQTFSSIEKPFTDENAQWALLLVISAAVVVGLLIGMLVKSPSSVWGLFVGLFYGYLLTIALVPAFLGVPPGSLSVLIGSGLAGGAATGGGQCQGLVDRFVCFMGQPGSAQMCGAVIAISLAVFVIFLAVSGNRSRKKNGSGSKNGSST